MATDTQENDDLKTNSPNRYWRWMVVFAVFIVVMFQMGTFKALGVYVPHFQEEFQISVATVGLMCSLGGGLKFLFGPLWGAITQISGYRLITIVGGIFAGLSLICVHLSTLTSHLALSMALLSIGMGLPSVAEVMALNDYFPDDLSVANGLAFTGGAVGMIIFPPFAEYLNILFGWRPAMLLLGAACFNICIAGVIMRPPKKSIYRTVSQESLQTYDADEDDKLAKFRKTCSSFFGFSVLAKEPILVTYLAAFCLWSIASAGWVIFLVPYTITLGYSAQTASFLSSIGGVGTLIGRLLTGPLTQRGLVTGRVLFIFLSFGSAGTLILYPFVQSYWVLVVISFLVGLCIGTPTPVVIVMLKELLPSDKDAFTGAIGLHYFALGMGLLSGGPLTGIVFDATGSYSAAFIAMAGIELLAGLLALVNTPQIIS
ncbi:monocarboxylate transporter 13-like [Amphiura filiformis]|uniref:monocarboxylate transporter 13-like n=1 Tax=Amphiura filiformis TaxID=82378 RepID=UPI003B22467C